MADNPFDEYSGPSRLDPRSRELAIRTVLGEAANEPDEGMVGVAAIIRNRVKAGRYGGSDVPSVVRAQDQFEPWSTSAGRQRMFSYSPESEHYRRAAAAVDRAFDEDYDPTGGMTHFFSPSAQAALGRRPPGWARGEALPIGRHTFYAPEGRVQVSDASSQRRSSNPFDQFGDPESATSSPASRPKTTAGANPFDQFEEPESVGVVGMAGEVAKRVGAGAVETMAAAPLRGLGAQRPYPAETGVLVGSPEHLAQIERDIEYQATTGREPPKAPTVPTVENPLYRAGEAVTKFHETYLPDKKVLNEVVSDVATGAGSLVGNIATTMVPGLRALSVPSLLSQGAGEAAERAVKAKASEEQIQQAARLGNISGATEFADAAIPLLLGKKGAALKETLKFLGSRGRGLLLGAGVEGLQEGVQQGIQNAIAKGIYKPDQELSEGVLYNMLIGAIVGGGAGAVLGHKGGESKAEEAPTAETLAEAGAAITPPVPPAEPPPPTAPPTGPGVVSRLQLDRELGGVEVGSAGPLGRPANANVSGTGADILPFERPEPTIVGGIPVQPAQTEPTPQPPISVAPPEETLPPPPAVPSPVGGFQTSKGSTYTLFDDGTTLRNKAERAEHPGDTGLKPKSDRTVFLSVDAANRLAPPQGEWRYIDHGDGTISVATPSLEEPGRWGVAPSQLKVLYDVVPTKGSIPLELWTPETIYNLPAYRAHHFGNPIINIGAAEVEFGPPPGMVTSPAALRTGGGAPPTVPGQAPQPTEAVGAGVPSPTPPSVVEPPPPVAREPATLPADHVRFMEEEAKRLGLETPPALQETITGRPFDPKIGPIDDSLSPLKEEIQTNPGADEERLADLLSQHLYGDMRNVAAVSVKEMFQNGFDAAKGFLEQNPGEHATIAIHMDDNDRMIRVQDDGLGMPASVMGNEFLKIAGTKKETKRASGGHGIAKMQFLFGSTKMRAISLRDGVYAELNTSGPELRAALKDKSKSPKMTVRPATEQDLKLFPKGHGTIVEVNIPDSYVDPSTGTTKFIGFQPYSWEYNVLERSPLFDNIDVTFNGNKMDMGANFPLENFTQFFNVDFDWGSTRIYIEKQPNSAAPSSNMHVLSNGLWQFSAAIKRRPNDWTAGSIPFTLYADVNPRVGSTEAGYPFSLNRQEFSPAVKEDFANIFNHISLVYQGVDLEESAKNFGSMQYIDFDEFTQRTTASPPALLEPKVPPAKTPLTLIQQGDTGRMENGKLIVNNRQIPTLTPEMLEQYKGVDINELRVDQSEIDPNRIILHDNVNVEVSAAQTLSVTEYGRERFAERFDEYVWQIGSLFRELRDVVVAAMPPPIVRRYKQAPSAIARGNTYEELGKEGIGISFDIEYRGVSIRLPFAGMFLNPFVPEYSDPVRAAVGMTGTMVHELAHHKVRGHDADFPAEMQRILIALDTHPTFDFKNFKQRTIDIVQQYEDVFTHMNGVFTSGTLTIRPRGKRFEDSGAQQAGDGRPLGDMDRSREEPGRGSQLSDWVALGTATSEGEPGRGEPALKVGRSDARASNDNGRRANYNATKHIDPGIAGPPQQPENSVAAAGIATVLNSTGGPPPTGGSGGGGNGSPPTGTTGQAIREARSHADRMNWYYKFMVGLTELLDANPFFAPLRKYVERVREMHNVETRVHDAAIRLLKEWRGLGDRAKKMENFIEDLQKMPYLSPAERKAQAWRHPSSAEMGFLIAKHGLDNETVKVYSKIKSMGDKFLDLVRDQTVARAERTFHDNPVKLAAKIDEINEATARAKSYPFFPFTRFGRYYVVVKDAANNIVHFETFEPKRFVGLSLKRAQRYQAARKAELQARLAPGHTIDADVLPETAEPFIGLPTLMLQQLIDPTTNLGITDSQRNALVLMQGMRNPAMSLRDRQVYSPSKLETPGYSMDMRRSFARYYFHGGRYLAKLTHSWALRGHVAEAQLAQDSNKGRLVGDYMEDHLKNVVLDSKGDFGFFRGAIFLWAMGYVPAAATQNMSQTALITLPYLAGKFGEHRAAPALVKAMTNLSTYYKRGRYDPMPGVPQTFEFEALAYGIKTGRITETQAADLAAISVGGTLFSGQGGSDFQRHVIGFQQGAAFMFEMMEQFNRRVAYRAGLSIAMRNPNHKFVKESINKYRDEYEQLAAIHGPQKAGAIITATHVVDQTQYTYARYARPRFMRGPLGATLFVFKRYLQSTVNMLAHNKSDVLPRYLVMALLMGGLGGVPGYEDVKHIFRAIGRWWFGKDSDPDRLARSYILDWFDGKIEPDLILHGLSRRGFGIPALVDMMGTPFTGRSGRGLGSGPAQNIPFPQLDRSRAISMGTILPFELGKVLEPTEKQDKVLADQIQKASGAVFSVGFNMIKAATDTHMESTDPKRWEKAMPRAIGAASRSYRAYSEGRERGRGGPDSAPTVIPYDVRDHEQMMEILALGMGYQNLRATAKWDRVLAGAEVQAFHTLQRKGLLESLFEAHKGGNSDEMEKVKDRIRQFNTDLPDELRSQVITAETAMRSMKGREKELQAKERGMPRQKTQVPLSREMDRLFPEALDVRRVR